MGSTSGAEVVRRVHDLGILERVSEEGKTPAEVARKFKVTKSADPCRRAREAVDRIAAEAQKEVNL